MSESIFSKNYYEYFLPIYPYVDDDFFQQKILNKKEFYDYKLQKEQEEIKRGELYNHQVIIQRFLSDKTLYDELLLYHSVGTGKTRAAFSVTENLYKTSSFTKVFVLTRNPDLLNSLMTELVSFSKRYKIPKEINEEKKISYMKKITGDFYTFKTFQIFAKELFYTPDEILKEKYRNSVFIMDEAHNIKSEDIIEEIVPEIQKIQEEFKEGIEASESSTGPAGPTSFEKRFQELERLEKLEELGLEEGESKIVQVKEKINVYQQFFRLFHTIENRKILLMTGTPMRNDVNDISYLLNLILPEDRQLPTGKNFDNLFITNHDIINQEQLKSYFKGKISILLPPENNKYRVTYEGIDISEPKTRGIEKFKLYQSQMSEFQTKYYIEAYNRDIGKETSIYARSRQANLFVFPNGKYGKEGLIDYMDKKGNLKQELINEVNTIDKLKKYSSKYAEIISNIESQENKNKIIYIYCSIVNGSGIKLFSKILELYGYKRCRGNEKSTGKRYISLTSETSKNTNEFKNLVDYFNKEKNKFGEYCKVIIGSRKISEGFTFKSVQVIHIATLHWNDTEIEQAKARAIRQNASNFLINAGIFPNILIYQHNALLFNPKGYKEDQVRSIDEQMITISKSKDILIRKMDRIIKEVAFDCPLVYKRNIREGVEGSDKCDYQECKYVCDDSKFEPTEEDLSTYQLYYYPNNDIINKIINLFSENFYLHINTIKDLIKEDYFILFRNLYDIIINNIPLINKYRITSYLREDNNIFYLVDNVILENNHYEMNFYCDKPFFIQRKNLKEIIKENESFITSNLIENIIETKDNLEFKNYLESLSIDIQEKFLEKALFIKYVELKSSVKSEWVEDIYKSYLTYFEDKIVSNLLAPKLRCLSINNKEWTNCIESLTENKREYDTKLEELENNPYGYYGIVEEDRFCIKDVRDKTEFTDKRKQKTGANCLQVRFNKDILAELCIHLIIPINTNYKVDNVIDKLKMTNAGRKFLDNHLDWDEEKLQMSYYWLHKNKIETCNSIKNWFSEKGLLIHGVCGKTGKVKN
jgi:hypothetical protein